MPRVRNLVGSRAAAPAVDALARVNARHPWSHNDHFHSWILAHLPRARGSALDVGCGRGELLAALAPHVATVHGIDVDPWMRAQAAARCAALEGVRVDDESFEEIEGPVDLATMVAVLHHLDLEAALARVRDLLTPGGRFLCVGLARPRTVRDQVWDVASMATNPLIGLIKHPWPSPARPQEPPFPTAKPAHTVDDVRAAAARVLPGATMRRRLGFRYTLAWEKLAPTH